jgi:hypothetical protein
MSWKISESNNRTVWTWQGPTPPRVRSNGKWWTVIAFEVDDDRLERFKCERTSGSHHYTTTLLPEQITDANTDEVRQWLEP